jgi:glutamate-1-semialdehyde 2,1-aminomutase
MFGLYFSKTPPNSFDEIMASDREKFKQFFHLMLEQGVYFGPSAFEAGFVSASHNSKDIDETILAANQAFRGL